MIKIGHRGAMGHAPENTIKSFDVALQMGVSMIELDVALCASGEVIVIHDDRVDRTTDGEGYVSEMSLESLLKLDAGDGEKIPTLDETLTFLAGKCELNIELKNKAVVNETAKLISKHIDSKLWTADQLLISSFDHHALKAFQEIHPTIRIGVLVGIIPLNYSAIIGDIDAYAINPCLDFLNEEFVKHAKERGLKVFVWTVNHIEDIKKMRNMGVDGIFTNYPDRL